MLLTNVFVHWDFADRLMGIRHSGGYLEHFTGSLTVRGCDDGSMDVLESALLEETMCRVRQVVTNTHNSTNGLGAATHVCDITKVLIGVLLFGKVIRVTGALSNNLDLVVDRAANLQFDELAFCGRPDQLTDSLEGGAGGLMRDFSEVGHCAVNNDLE